MDAMTKRLAQALRLSVEDAALLVTEGIVTPKDARARAADVKRLLHGEPEAKPAKATKRKRAKPKAE